MSQSTAQLPDAPELLRLQRRVERERQAREAAESLLEQKSREVYLAQLHSEMANRTKSEFLANLSHELRTPLNGIIGFAEVLETGLSGPLNEQQTQYIGSILNAARRLNCVFNEMLEIAKLDLAAKQLSPEFLDLGILLPTCISPLAQRAIEKNLRFETATEQDLPEVWADPNALRKVFLNVIGNAIKFTPAEGSVTVHVGSRYTGHVLVTVADSGIGIPRSELCRVFTPFYQVHQGLSREFEGSGLGLTIAKTFAELQGGRITLESQEGEGTTVYVELPTSKAQCAPAPLAHYPSPELPPQARADQRWAGPEG